MVGMFEGEGAPWSVGGVPEDSSFLTLDPNWERMAPYLEQAMARVPRTLEVGAKQLFCGPESFTPDLAPIVGEAPELRNYFVAAGLNSIGILSGPGIGRLLADWIVSGAPDPCDDVTGMHIDRLHRFMGNPEFRAARVAESLGNVYKCHYPTKSVQSARGARRSPLHDRLLSAGAQFKDVSGWESPDWCVCAAAPPLRDVETLHHSTAECTPPERRRRSAAALSVLFCLNVGSSILPPTACPSVLPLGCAASLALSLAFCCCTRAPARTYVAHTTPCRYNDDGSISAEAAAKLEWGRHAWWSKWRREHRACREGVVLIDMSFMSKFLVQGPDAGAVLDRLSTAAGEFICLFMTITVHANVAHNLTRSPKHTSLQWTMGSRRGRLRASLPFSASFLSLFRHRCLPCIRFGLRTCVVVLAWRMLTIAARHLFAACPPRSSAGTHSGLIRTAASRQTSL